MEDRKSVEGWGPVGARDHADWLNSLSGSAVTGFHPRPTDHDGLWILNAMYERTTGTARESHHERHRRDLASGAEPPLVIGDWNELEDGHGMTVTGGSMGWSEHPGTGWRRLPWRELAERTGDPISPPGLPPCYRAFPSAKMDGSWPTSIEPPTEGSLDIESFRALAKVLREHAGSDTVVMAFYCQLYTGDFDDLYILQGTLGTLEELEHHWMPYSPSNIWPSDRSWLMTTDTDLWGTQVSGPSELLAAVEADTGLETVRLPPLDTAEDDA
ncbi:hypothetical protein [Salininema proteolyticum]|uniref:Endonuclease/Exonuclease/phosphatase family protein n=1 Tax=Salininema proteolyticum TaxID=1607685 RepID=A0ABV8U132_9ACTN